MVFCPSRADRNRLADHAWRGRRVPRCRRGIGRARAPSPRCDRPGDAADRRCGHDRAEPVPDRDRDGDLHVAFRPRQRADAASKGSHGRRRRGRGPDRGCLPALLALSANSPFWQGVDTGYASYRTQIWQRWPTAGMPPELESRAEFDLVLAEMVATGVISDGTYLYWYVRPSARFDTLEFRVADVCLSA